MENDRAAIIHYLGNQLQVERSGNLQLLTNGVDNHLDVLHCLLVEVLGRRHQRGIARVNTGILHVLRYRHGHHYPVAGYSINIDLLEKEITLERTVQV